MHPHFSELPFYVCPLSSCPSFHTFSSSWALSSISSLCVQVVMVCPVLPASFLFPPSLRQSVSSQPSCHREGSLQVFSEISLATLPLWCPRSSGTRPALSPLPASGPELLPCSHHSLGTFWMPMWCHPHTAKIPRGAGRKWGVLQ